MSALHPEAMTWTALLAKWVEFAQASLAIPDDADGSRWRASVPATINLQSVTFALGDLDHIPAAEHPLALDKADLLIRRSVDELQRTWNGAAMSHSLTEIVQDAQIALAARKSTKPPAR